MLDDKCGNCRFWRHHENKQFELGDCRRRSPIVAVMQSESFIGNNGSRAVTYWPDTRYSSWCGEYEQRA